jgi:NAD(P)-dependent dehydrogenase (short-subunit alcohol dehydrogenase family)
VLAWTRTIAREWAQFGIRVNAVALAILTPMAQAATARLSDDERAMEKRMLEVAIPLGGRLGDADLDMAPVMVFLASGASRFITGQTLCVDGGAVLLS